MADSVKFVFCVFLVSASLSCVLGISCYECNVWKAGYGQLCDNPKVRTDCKVCMKVETNSYIVRYSDTPRHSRIISRVCGNHEMTHFGVECHYYTSADGNSKRCYCDTDLCNSAPTRLTATLTTATLIGLLTYYISRSLW